MKKFLLGFLPVLLLLAACTKEKSLENGGVTPQPGGPGNPGNPGGPGNSTYFLNAKVNGTAKTFNEDLGIIKEDTLGLTMFTLTGYASAVTTDFETIVISIGTMSGTLQPGTYSIGNVLSGIVIGVYVNADATKQYLAFTGDTSSDPFTVTITSVTATEIAGTFKGKLFELDMNTGMPNPNSSVTLTEGSFKAKIL